MAAREFTSFFKKQSSSGMKCKFLGQFIDDPHLIWRVLVESSAPINVNDFSFACPYTNPQDCSITVLGSYKTEAEQKAIRYCAYLSLSVPLGTRNAALLYKDDPLWSLWPQETHRLDARLFNRLVSPLSDPEYTNYLQQDKEKVAALVADSGILSTANQKTCFSLICPLYNTPPHYLRVMMDSVCAQTYQNWELILVNASPQNNEMKAVLQEYHDERIVCVNLKENMGIACNTNQGIEHAHGDYICFIDHDDAIEPNTLAAYALEIQKNNEVDLIYCDEDSFENDLTKTFGAIYKPDFNLDFLYSHNYIVHFLCVSRRIIEIVKPSSQDMDGAQDYDLLLKAAEHARAITHIPHILYHWRKHPDSTNAGNVESKPYALESPARALREHFKRREIPVCVEQGSQPFWYDVHFEPEEKTLTNTTIVLWGDDSDSIAASLNALLQTCFFEENDKHPYQFLGHILVITSSVTVKKAVEEICLKNQTRTDKAVDIVVVKSSSSIFSFAEVVAELQRKQESRNDFLSSNYVFIREGVLVNDWNSLKDLVGYLQRPEIGMVSATTCAQDGLVEGTGIYVDIDSVARRLSTTALSVGVEPAARGGYNGFAISSSNYGAIRPYCFAMRANVFIKVATYIFTNPDTAVKQHDVLLSSDFYLICLSALLRSKGYLIATTPTAKVVTKQASVWNDTCNRWNLINQFNLDYQKHFDASEFDRPQYLCDTVYPQDPLANPNLDYSTGFARLVIRREKDNAE